MTRIGSLGFFAAFALAACDGSDSGSGGASSTGSESTGAESTGSLTTGSQSTGSQSTGSQSTGSQSTGSQSTTSGSTTTGGGSPFSAESLALCEEINAYRVSEGLDAVPVSVALMTVAEAHVADLSAHPEIAQGECNLHSWSEGSPEWSGCCYTADHAQAQCMWSKPSQLTESWGANQYTGNGFEIAAGGTGSPEAALAAWQGSPPHHAVILNDDIWADYSPWPAMGCGLLNGYAAVWFGDAVDPQTL